MASLRFLTLNHLEQSYASLMNGPPIVLGAINSCDGTPGSPLITRASGSYITAGVRPGALLSGAISARFPANTYVLIVEALQLTMSANATADGTNEAATFTPYVTRDEVSPYVMENAMDHERRKLWQATGVGVIVDFDLGANRNVTAAAMMGHRGLGASGAGASTIVVQSSASANGYPPAAGTSWSNRATLNNPSRDLGAVFNNVSARWWRFEFTVVSASFSLGKFALGVLAIDLGFLWSPGGPRLGISPNVEERTVGLDPVISYVGDDREHWDLPYRSILNASRLQLDNIRKLRTSVIIVEKGDVFKEAIVRRGEFGWTPTHEQASDTVQDATLALEILG